MPEWVTDEAVPLAPEHLGDRHLDGGAHLDGVGENAVDVLQLEQQHDRRTTEWGCDRVEFGDLLAEQELVRPDGELDEKHPPVGEPVRLSWAAASRALARQLVRWVLLDMLTGASR